jgi:formylglycine-generating enzyme required for sulfatase activity
MVAQADKECQRMAMNNDERIKQLEAEVERLRGDCAEAYQVLGYLTEWVEDDEHGDIDRVLDNLWAAQCGEPKPHDDILPWPKGEIVIASKG